MGSGSLSSVAMEKVLNFGWNPPNSVPNADVFLQTGTPVLSQNSTQFSTDSPFIEWAARFSCFNSGDFSNVVNPIRTSEHLNPYSKGVGIQMLEVPLNNGLDAVSGAQSQKNESQMTDVVRDYIPVDNGTLECCLTKNGGESGGLLVSSNEEKDGTGASNNEADEPEFGSSVQGGQFVSENASGEPSAKALGVKKRKTSSQMDIELDQSKGSPHLSVETLKENVEPKQNGEKNAATIAAKTIGKHSKGGCQKSDAPKEDYIHVRARRGQATNSHSLAERVRREKISERMKYLQDLVPGCNKVTGKAVMLDEIINYVQSLQRQVEVMSMKLAVVNPWLDFNIEALLSKDIFQSQGSTPPTLGFLPDMGMAHPQLHPLHHGFIQVASPSIGNHSDFLRRTISSQLTPMNRYKEPAAQIKNAWNDELHDVVQMSYSDDGPFNTQELNGSLPPGHVKVEL
ncbi:hypothetical protein AAC387_Pa09g0954 [Persea americana]